MRAGEVGTERLVDQLWGERSEDRDDVAPESRVAAPKLLGAESDRT